jgi:hypothetical protein
MGHLCNRAIWWFDSLGSQEWLFILMGVILIGLVSLRGFGSRSGY